MAEKNYGIEYVDKNKKYCADLLETFSEDVFDFKTETIYNDEHKRSYKFGIPIKTNVSYTESINEINNAGIQFATAFEKKFGEEVEPKIYLRIFHILIKKAPYRCPFLFFINY